MPHVALCLNNTPSDVMNKTEKVLQQYIGNKTAKFVFPI
jgi:hypothetical protein